MTELQRTSSALTTEEAAEILRVPVSWLEDAGRAGKVPGRIKLGHYVRWDEPTLREFLRSSIEPTVEVGRTALSKAQAKAKSKRAA